MKFVILGDKEGYELPIIFPAMWGHDEVARALTQAGQIVVAAGFVQVTEGGEVACSGRSSSLGIPSRPKRDAAVIAKWLAEG